MRAGDGLYLPPLTWHCVTQAGPAPGEPCVSINYCHDMVFDGRWAAAELADVRLVASAIQKDTFRNATADMASWMEHKCDATLWTVTL